VFIKIQGKQHHLTTTVRVLDKCGAKRWEVYYVVGLSKGEVASGLIQGYFPAVRSTGVREHL
jgi:hypothetical protein